MNNLLYILAKGVSLILLPPLNCLLLAGFGGLLLVRRRRVGIGIVVGALAALYALSTPWIGAALRAQLESRWPPTDYRAPKAQAIVILGGGSIRESPEYAGDTVGSVTLERLRWAVRLHKQTGLPILATGGNICGLKRSEADLMIDALQQDFAVHGRWVEGTARTTLENGVRSHEILAQEGINRVILVTHAWHMPRAVLAFRRAGFDVVPAPTSFQSPHQLSVLSFVAGMDGLNNSWIYFHETIGMLWYRLLFFAGAAAP